jgi:hypothetical protein
MKENKYTFTAVLASAYAQDLNVFSIPRNWVVNSERRFSVLRVLRSGSNPRLTEPPNAGRMACTPRFEYNPRRFPAKMQTAHWAGP